MSFQPRNIYSQITNMITLNLEAVSIAKGRPNTGLWFVIYEGCVGSGICTLYLKIKTKDIVLPIFKQVLYALHSQVNKCEPMLLFFMIKQFPNWVLPCIF